MRLADLFHVNQEPIEQEEPEHPRTFGEALGQAFDILCRGDQTVAQNIADCLADTKGYCAGREQALDARGLVYREEAEPWLQFIAAVSAAEQAGYLCEIDRRADEDTFRKALEKILKAAGIVFSLRNLPFERINNIPGRIAQFNEYAGQSGITIYCLDTESGCFVLGAARIADYAEAAQIAAEAGIRITSRPMADAALGSVRND